MIFYHQCQFSIVVIFLQIIYGIYAQGVSTHEVDYIYISETQSFYKFQAERSNWKDAVKKCAKEGAELFYPVNKCEADIVVASWKETPAYGWAYIGISKSNNTEFKTTDGRSILDVYNNWRIGEPNNENGIENCVTILRDGTLNDVNCRKLFPYICKKKREPREGPVLCDQAETSKQEMTFRKDYVFLANTKSFYKFHTINRNWQDAKDVCSSEGAFLFYPKNTCESNTVFNFWNQTQIFDRIFVGISASTVGSFETIDGFPVRDVYYNWAPGEPDNAHGNENCVILTIDRMYNDVRCDIHLPFICKKILESDNQNAVCDEPIIKPRAGDNQTQSFRKDYKYLDDTQSFYKIHTIYQNWNDAKATCENEEAILFIPENECEAKVVVEFWTQTQPFDKAYVGVSNPSKEVIGGFLNYETVDGRPVWKVYNMWSRGEPNNINGDQNCVIISREGTFSADMCDKKIPFICKKVIDNKNAFCYTDEPVKLGKGYRYLQETQSLYKFHTSFKNWRSAKQTCEGEEAFLFYPETTCEADLVLNLATKEHAFRRIHVGIFSLARGLLQTVNGVSLGEVYGKWQPGKPSTNEDESENCVVLRFEDYALSSDLCNEKYPFICKKLLSPRRNNYGCDRIKDEAPAKRFRKDYTYLEDVQAYYKLHTISNTWSKAKEICEQEGADLLYPESECELNVLVDFWHSSQPWTFAWVFVGISRNAEGKFENIFGKQEPNLFLKWGKSEPNNVGNVENCVQLHRFSSDYNDIICNHTSFFFCKKKMDSGHKDYLCHMTDTGNSTDYINAGYTYLNETKTFYKFHTKNRNWEDANKVCEKEEASVFYPNNECEAKAVLDLWKQTHPFGWMFIGITSTPEGIFQTVDRKLLSDPYNNWRPGEPNNEGGNENCVVLVRDGTLMDESCNKTFPFICRKRRRKRDMDSVCDQIKIDVRQAGENDGYVFLNNTQSFYKIYTLKQSWQNATQICKKEEATLFYPENICEANTILEYWNQTQLFRSIFVGISSPSVGVFETINGRPTWEMYINWRPGEPNNENGNENCVAFLRDGTYADVRCDTRFPFICKKTGSSSAMIECDQPKKDFEENLDFRLDYTFLKKTRSFYKIHTILDNWENAKDTCVKEGATLFYAENEIEAFAVLDLWKLTQPFDKVYVGMWNPKREAAPKTSDFLTIDGRMATDVFNKWQVSEPNNENGIEFCVVLSREGVLKDDQCGNKYGFICKTTMDSVITSAIHGKNEISTSEDWRFKKEYTYLEESQSYYKFHTQFKNWQLAKEKCDEEGAALFYPENICEANAVLQMWRQTQFFRRAFIGISSLIAGKFETIHGSPIWLVYNNWLPGEPNNANNRENCVVLYVNGTLNDEQCESRIPFICKRKKYSQTTSACSKVQINETQLIQKDYTFIEDTKSLYKIHTILQTWNTAKRICTQEGASLFYPENECEAKAVLKFWKQTQPYEWLFLGISSTTKGKFETVDGRPIWQVYNKWRPSQPDNTDNSEDCVSMFRDDGSLNDERCFVTAPFICKKKSALVEVEAVCEKAEKHSDRITNYVQDYTYLEDLQNLYKIHTIFQNWENASKVCNKEGATIFYPENEEELKAVLRFWDQTQTYSKVLIGFPTTNTKLLTTSNDEDAQKLKSGKNDCNLLHRDGKISDDSCSNVYPFVCKKALAKSSWNIFCDIADLNYRYSGSQRKCYKMNLKPMNWSSAFATCTEEQSYLAVINSQDEADFLVKIIRDAVKSVRVEQLPSDVYLGFHSQKSKDWKTVTGKLLQESGYNKWSADVTQNQNRCGTMFYNGTLNHLNCSERRFFICEHELDESEDDINLRRG